MHRYPSMRACTGRKRVLLVLSSMCALVASAGCDDDATGPPPSAEPWSEIQLPTDLDGGSILDLAFGPGRNLVLGYRRIDSDPGVFPALLPILLEFGSRGWTDLTPELLGPRMLPLAVTLICRGMKARRIRFEVYGPPAGRISKSVTISAFPLTVAATEQYLSWERAMAWETALSVRPLPARR